MRGCGGCGRDQSDAAKRLSAAVLESPAMAWCGGRRQPFVASHGSSDHRDLVQLVSTVVVTQPGRTGAGPAADAAVVPDTGVGSTAAGASAAGSAPKRLHQPLGARRHSTEVIQPSGLCFLLCLPKPPEYKLGDVHLEVAFLYSTES